MEQEHNDVPRLSLIEEYRKPTKEDLVIPHKGNGFTCLNEIISFKQRKMKIGRMWILLIDQEQHCIGYSEIALLDLKDNNPNIKEILQISLVSNAHSVILYQQRSGIDMIEPTEMEFDFYRKLFKACELVDVQIDESFLINEVYASLYSFILNKSDWYY